MSNISNCGGRLKQKRSAFLFRHFHGGGGSDGIERDIDFPSTSSANGGARNGRTPTPPSLNKLPAASMSIIVVALFPFLLAFESVAYVGNSTVAGRRTRRPSAFLHRIINDESRSEVTIPIHFEVSSLGWIACPLTLVSSLIA